MDISKIPSPCFVLDEALLRRNLRLIDGVQKEAGVQIILAFKGFAMWSAFPIVHEYLSGATASSLSEATYGMIIMPMTRPALSMLKPGKPGSSR